MKERSRMQRIKVSSSDSEKILNYLDKIVEKDQYLSIGNPIKN